MAQKKLTPMLEHYLRVKDEHPDALLFYRMGDFYELFFEDAEVAARELQIALTSRDRTAESKTPMCGVPHHAVEGYLSQLLEKGFKVAVCDQVEDPKQAKGLVKREVTRVLTPGTVTEDSNLSAKQANYLAALLFDPDRSRGGLAWMDFSTGEWRGLTVADEQELWQWAIKLGPSELLLPKGAPVPPAFADLAPVITALPTSPAFDIGRAQSLMLTACGVEALATLDLDDKPELLRACGALLTYLRQTQMQDPVDLGEFNPVNLSSHLLIDEVTERNLELFQRLDGKTGPGTLRHVLDRTLTPMGGRQLNERLKRPWRRLSPIEQCQDCVTRLFEEDESRARMRELLNAVYDLERLSTRVVIGRAAPKDFAALRESLDRLPPLKALLADMPDLPKGMARLLKHWDDMSDVLELLDRALASPPPAQITDGGLFKPGYDARLDELIELTEHGQSALDRLFEEERDQGNIPKLKMGYNKVFGYYFEVSRAFQGTIPDYFIRKQTLVNCERYVTPDLKELEEKLLSASDERKNLEYNLYLELRREVAQSRTRFLFMAQAVAWLDYWQGLAEAARTQNWTRPDVHESMETDIERGRHPVVEQAQGANYIPNSLSLDKTRRILLITGPNMAGKSTVLRQAALLVIMAQMGSFVPADKARIGLCDRVFSRVGASDNLAQGQSTFMVEMMETARILRLATGKSLVILDEIGRGTSTYDGLALAWAVVEDLSRRGSGKIRTLFATHYHELTSLEGTVDGLKNLNIAVKEYKGDIVFLRRLIPGPADKSYGIEVARLAGVPRPVVDRAREVLAKLEEKPLHERRQAVVRAAQPSLPGMAPDPDAPASVPDADHPILNDLKDLDVNQLTPLKALTLLNEWKSTLSEET